MPWPTKLRQEGEVYACAKCGSTECESECWVTINGNVITDACGSGEDIWCPVCETHDTTLVLIAESLPGRDAEKTEKKAGL